MSKEVRPLFSILIANYNNGRYLQEAIDSVLAQSYTHWEIILVDDKSLDNSSEIYEKYAADVRFHIYYNDRNQGCGYTKRRCAELANGELCGFLDPDDALMPTALEAMVEAHAAHPECSLIYSTCYRYSGDRNEEMPVWDLVGKIPSDKDMLIYRQKIVGHFTSFKKKAYDASPGMNPFLKADVDRDLYLLLEEHGNVLHIPVPLYLYRINNAASISIGDQKREVRTYHYSLISQLDAICRRLGGPLYRKNKGEYLDYMRSLLSIYRHSSFFSWKRFVKYTWHYLKARHFSPHAFSHIHKILKKKK
ncbi:MAG: glycosyltransferase [Bacteroidales bacterium]|nr:glycosyltransferase [Bacteroidales bacterium]